VDTTAAVDSPEAVDSTEAVAEGNCVLCRNTLHLLDDEEKHYAKYKQEISELWADPAEHHTRGRVSSAAE
jgi:hypothetical protein